MPIQIKYIEPLNKISDYKNKKNNRSYEELHIVKFYIYLFDLILMKKSELSILK